MERLSLWRACLVALVLLVAFTVPQATNAAVTVKTVPLDPANPTSPHFTYPLDGTHEVTIVLGATVDLGGSTDSFTYSWNFGDGTPPTAAAPVTQPFDISAQHQYPFGAAGGTMWTAVVTVKDTHTNATFTGNYYVIQQANNLASRVNVAIDAGLWYLHQSQWRCNNGLLSGGPFYNTPNGNCGVGGVFGPNGKFGGWDEIVIGCVFSPCYANTFYEAINGANVNAFEVNGHFEHGPASDPYTDDVNNALARMIMVLGNAAVTSKTFNYALPSCPSPPCSFTFDGNSNGQAVYASATSYTMYEGGSIIDALVGTGTPGTVSHTGKLAGGGLPGLNGETYGNIVQDMIDGYNYCQNTFNNVTGLNGGGWGYFCPPNNNYNDNSVSQWAAIGEIAAFRGFGVPPPPIVTDANKLWLSQDQCTTSPIVGAFGYYTACYEPWGPYAVTPSGMVQLAMDSQGRGNSQWNAAETFYHDNFCNSTTSGPAAAPRQYTYGMFSFTKSMLLHDPGGVLTPITFLADQPGNTHPIDWYNAVGPESGGADVCDGVAQTLTKRQGTTGGIAGGTVGSPNPTAPQNGYWEGHYYNGGQDPFETAWSIIMLRKTVFVACVNNLYGQGTPFTGTGPARVDLTWTGINGAASYNVLRGTTPGGPYPTNVGNSTLPAFKDTSGLVNGDTYYYVLQPLNNNGGAICQSNQATVTVPVPRHH